MKRNHSNFSRNEYLFLKTPIKNLLQFIYSLNLSRVYDFKQPSHRLNFYLFVYIIISGYPWRSDTIRSCPARAQLTCAQSVGVRAQSRVQSHSWSCSCLVRAQSVFSFVSDHTQSMLSSARVRAQFVPVSSLCPCPVRAQSMLNFRSCLCLVRVQPAPSQALSHTDTGRPLLHQPLPPPTPQNPPSQTY